MINYKQNFYLYLYFDLTDSTLTQPQQTNVDNI